MTIGNVILWLLAAVGGLAVLGLISMAFSTEEESEEEE